VTCRAPLMTLMVRGGTSFLKSAHDTDKFVSTLNRMGMKLHTKLGQRTLFSRFSIECTIPPASSPVYLCSLLGKHGSSVGRFTCNSLQKWNEVRGKHHLLKQFSSHGGQQSNVASYLSYWWCMDLTNVLEQASQMETRAGILVRCGLHWYFRWKTAW